MSLNLISSAGELNPEFGIGFLYLWVHSS